jgi:hypothetical protein
VYGGSVPAFFPTPGVFGVANYSRWGVAVSRKDARRALEALDRRGLLT